MAARKRIHLGLGEINSAVSLTLAAMLPMSAAAVSFPQLFGNHAIVQRSAATAIWGRAEPGEEVEVTLGTVSAKARAEADGWWLARLDTTSMGDGPFTLAARGASGSEARSEDILVGEVWLAGGQSNMEFTMSGWSGAFGNIIGFDKRAAASAGRPIRVFRSNNPCTGKAPVKGDAKGWWIVASPETIGGCSAVGYTFIDTLQREIGGAAGVIDISVGGTRCWAWMPRETLDAHEELKAERLRQEVAAAKGESIRRPVQICWDNRFFPVSKLSCRGVIWYQGCCDSDQKDSIRLYPRWFSYMVSDMRRELGDPALPFLYCQIAGWDLPAASPDANPGAANLREAQRRAQRLIPESGMAVTLDTSEHEVHGRFKEAAGDRLAALALNRVYGCADVVCRSPDFLEATFGADSAIVRFATEGSPLVAGPIRESYTWNAKSNDVIRVVRHSSPASQLEGFTIRDGAGKWHWADARIVGLDTVEVRAADARNPTAVRYNWGMQGFGNLCNAAGLPASCFTTEAPESSPYGVCSHLAGGERDERPRTLDAVRAAGLGMVRCDFWWSAIEKADGTWDFSLQDAVVAEAKAAGITILPILGNIHPRHPTPAYEDDGPWRRYVRAVAERYAADCPVFEVWNEPNHGQYGYGCQNPTNYVKVLKAAFEEIRAAAPAAKVAVGGFAGVPWNYIETLLSLGGGAFFDIMNVHAYCIPKAPEYHYMGEGGFPRRLWALMGKYGCGGREIWVTEFGWPTNETDPAWPVGTKEFYSKVGVDETRQALYLPRALGLGLAEGLTALFPYELRDRGGDRFDRESRFGLLHNDFSHKPAYDAYATFVAMRPAGSTRRARPFADGDLYFPQWRCPDGTSCGMVWTTGPDRTVSLHFAPAPALGSEAASASRVRFRTHLGEELHPPRTPDGAYALSVSEGPVYFSGAELVPPTSSTARNSTTTQGEKP